MNNTLIDSADTISLFFRLQANSRPGITIRSSEMGVLIFIQKQKSAVTPITISQFFKITKPSVTSLINSLVKKGYLFKIKSEKDRRSYALKLTENIGLSVAIILHEAEKYRNTTHTITRSKSLNYYEIADILSLVLKRKISYKKPGFIKYWNYYVNKRGLDR